MRTMWVGCLVLTPLLLAAGAQRTQRAAPLRAKPSSAAEFQWPQSKIQFSEEKPVLGLPLRSIRSMVRCSSDNTAYFNLGGDLQLADAAGTPRLYSISTDGEVKSVLRTLPVDFNTIHVSDFFVSDRMVVTLLYAAKDYSQGMRESAYFLSMLDPQGDFRDLVKMEGHFRPLKVAVFGDGEMLVLGWDEANMLPILAVLKEDGTIRRFLDTGDANANGAFGRGIESLVLLQQAAFVPFGRDVLLTFPGTAAGVVMFTPAGVARTIPIQIPSDYVLHDVLNSNGSSPLVVRVQSLKAPAPKRPFEKQQDPPQRLLEMSLEKGRSIRELVFDKPEISDVTCGGKGSLTAIFGDGLPDTRAKKSASSIPEFAKQLVVASMLR